MTGETYIINHRFTSMKDASSIFSSVKSEKCSILGRLLTSYGLCRITTKVTHGYEAKCMQQHMFNYFCNSDHWGFIGDVSLTFIGKADLSDPSRLLKHS